MAEVVGAFGLSHTAFMIHSFAKADAAQGERVRDAYAGVAERLVELRPDALVVISSEHFKTFFFNNFPTFCLGTASSYETWGEHQTPKCVVPGAVDLSRALLDHAVLAGFDLAFSESFMLDHGFVAPLHLIRPQMDIPIVPLFVNCTTPPLPTLERCHALGVALRRGIDDATSGRVVIIGTGGLSHWLGTPEMGRINERFDRLCLQQLVDGRLQDLLSLDNDTVVREAGNGGDEIRNWLVMLGAAGATRGDVLLYEPVTAWSTGIAVAEAACSPSPAPRNSRGNGRDSTLRSSFGLSDLAFRLTIDEALLAEFRSGDRDSVIDSANLAESERAALLSCDPAALLEVGLHPLILLQLAFVLGLRADELFAGQDR